MRRTYIDGRNTATTKSSNDMYNHCDTSYQSLRLLSHHLYNSEAAFF